MKANKFDHTEVGPAKGKLVETTVCNVEEVDLFVEGLEDVIAPRLAANHNETMARDDEEIKLEVEEPEAPGIAGNHKHKRDDTSNRRNFLKAAGAGLVAASVPSIAAAAPEDTQKVFYAHGMAWNPELPGIFAELRLTFDIAVRLGRTGLGTFGDDVHPEFNSHFKINSTAKHGNVYDLEGEIIAARDPAMVGMPVTIVAEVEGSTTGVMITLGTHTFKGAGLVVIAIIAILIGLLLPACTGLTC